VAQETFTVVWDRVGQVADDPRGLMAWVLRIARNRAIDRLRARRRWLKKAARLHAHLVGGELVANAPEPDEAAAPGWHVHRVVHAALGALPPEQQVAVHLAYFEGRTHSEIARALGVPLGTVKTRLRLAFEKLRGGLASIKDWVV
jgi:RNA polymerase sigma-70 factor (ECF subfamily)